MEFAFHFAFKLTYHYYMYQQQTSYKDNDLSGTTLDYQVTSFKGLNYMSHESGFVF